MQPEQLEQNLTPATYFKRRSGTVNYAVPLWSYKAPIAKPRNPAKAAGLRFERKVLTELDLQFKEKFFPHLAFRFAGASARGTAITDGMLFALELETICIIEVKLRHSADAWHQLNEFYVPIVKKAFPGRAIRALEIVKYYDPAVFLPGEVELISDPLEWIADSNSYGIMIWR